MEKKKKKMGGIQEKALGQLWFYQVGFQTMPGLTNSFRLLNQRQLSQGVWQTEFCNMVWLPIAYHT